MTDWPTLVASVGAGLGAMGALVTSRRIHRAVQPNGDTLVDLVEYNHARMHDILNSLYKHNLILAELARRAGIPLPDPEPPIPWPGRIDGPLD